MDVNKRSMEEKENRRYFKFVSQIATNENYYVSLRHRVPWFPHKHTTVLTLINNTSLLFKNQFCIVMKKLDVVYRANTKYESRLFHSMLIQVTFFYNNDFSWKFLVAYNFFLAIPTMLAFLFKNCLANYKWIMLFCPRLLSLK